jgi:hypothetical protein
MCPPSMPTEPGNMVGDTRFDDPADTAGGFWMWNGGAWIRSEVLLAPIDFEAIKDGSQGGDQKAPV